jgi:hypothetical protein
MINIEKNQKVHAPVSEGEGFNAKQPTSPKSSPKEGIFIDSY